MTANRSADLLNLSALTALLSGADADLCCASLYAHPAVRWVFGDEFHPGGERTTRTALRMMAVGPDDHLLDLACGKGDSAVLAAREFGCAVTGIDRSDASVIDACRAAEAAAVAGPVRFSTGCADALPFADDSFDAVLCECSLCLFADKRRALYEIRRVLRPGGRVVIADVLAEQERLPASLRGALAAAACVGSALSQAELLRMLDVAGFDPVEARSCSEEAAQMAQRVRDRLRGARIVAGGQDELAPILAEAVAMAEAARSAIGQGALDYAILVATRRPARHEHERSPGAT
jgi:arsenite methyltransferase